MQVPRVFGNPALTFSIMLTSIVGTLFSGTHSKDLKSSYRSDDISTYREQIQRPQNLGQDEQADNERGGENERSVRKVTGNTTDTGPTVATLDNSDHPRTQSNQEALGYGSIRARDTVDRTDPEGQLKSQRDEMAKMRAQIDAMKGDLINLQRRNQQVEKEMRFVNDALLAVRRERDSYKEDTLRLNRRKETLKQDLNSKTKEASDAHQEQKNIALKYESTRKLLDARTLELAAAQSILVMGDLCSGAEVINLVESLNSEIHQTAAFIADSFSSKCLGEKAKVTAGVQTAYGALSDIVGKNVLRALWNIQREDKEILTQITCQAVLASVARRIIASWCFVNEGDQIFDEAYASMRDTEAQSVFGKWRAWTRMHIQRSANVESSRMALYPTMAGYVVHLLLLAGNQGSADEIRDVVVSKYGERLETITKMALRLNKATGEEFTSGDLNVIIIPGNVTFDPLEMEDSYHDNTLKNNVEITEKVLCTTGVGLELRAKVPKGESFEEMRRLLCKPSVVSETFMETLTGDAGSQDPAGHIS